MKRILALILLASQAVPASAEVSRQVLDVARSQVLVQLATPYLSFRGKVSGITGELHFDPKNLAQSKLSLVAKNPQLHVTEQEAPFDVTSLIETLAEKGGTFVSEKIESRGKGALAAFGRYRIGTKTGSGWIPFEYRAISPAQTELRLAVAQDLDQNVDGVPIPIVPGMSNGSVKTVLLFTDSRRTAPQAAPKPPIR